MTHTSCPTCRIRFTPAAAATLVACPQCGEPPQASPGPIGVVGFRLFTLTDVPYPQPEAIAVSVALPDPASMRPGPVDPIIL
jgi:hypothetical protein